GLWLRIEDAEVFFYSLSRINSDHRFQVEKRASIKILSSPSTWSSKFNQHQNQIQEVITYILTIDDVNHLDEGNYSCQVDNQHPRFVTNDYSSTTTYRTQMGKNVTLSCRAQGKPLPLITWIKKADIQKSININCTSPCLINIVNATKFDAGVYECIAANFIRSVVRIYELDVQYPPDVSSTQLKVHRFPDDSVTFVCFVDSNPDPNIRWFHIPIDSNNNRIDLTAYHQQQHYNSNEWSIVEEKLNSTRWKTVLYIKHVPKRFLNTEFICYAKNKLGDSKYSIHLAENLRRTDNHVKKHRITTTSSLIASKDDEYLSLKLLSDYKDVKFRRMDSSRKKAHHRRLYVQLFY
ncbi:unnamed protein product, partial [Didymodactylos carnosus]